MTPDFPIAQGNRLPTLRAILHDIDGTLVPLNTAIPPIVTLVLRQRAYPLAKIDGVALITDPETSAVEYVWEEGDTDVPGLYFAYWQVTYDDGSSVRVPNDSFFTVAIAGN